MDLSSSFLFDRWPRIAARHPWKVVGVTAVLLVALVAFSLSFRGHYTDALSIPNTESQHALDLLKQRFPQQAGDTATVVVRAPAGMNDPQVKARTEKLVADMKTLPDVVAVADPYAQPGTISQDGTIARINVQYDHKTRDLPNGSVQKLADLRKATSTSDFQVEIGGSVIRAIESPHPGNSEVFGVAAAVIILLIAFGSVVAMGLPIVTALLALGSGMLIVLLLARSFSMPSFTPEFGAMIGLGVGIDYALLTVTRFREGLADGMSVDDSISLAGSTAGRAVLFAGSTVVIAMLGLWAVGIPFVAYVGTAAAIIVTLAVLVTLFVQPAVLRIVGRHIDRWHVPFIGAVSRESRAGFGYRLSRLIQRAPIPALVLSLGLLVVLALPLTRMQIGSSDAGNNPTSFTSRRAYDLLAQGFGPGYNATVVVAVRIDSAAAVPAVDKLSGEIKAIPGVAAVSPVIYNTDKTAATILVTPTTSPQSHATNQLVHRLRSDVAPDLKGSGATALVGGSTAAFIDIGDRITSRLPIFFGAVIGLSFLLLMAVFRSLLVPLKAAFMNLLAIGAAYGILVAVFQWGWGGSIIGVRPGPIESFLPMFLFAILFGLSMDYEVFLVSRIREEYLMSSDSAGSVARGLSVTTRLITAAAAIMVAVFLSFAFGDNRVVKEFGIGLATAIFVDATLVRLILVPAFMQVAGDWNWWFPKWLDRLVPRISIEGHHLAPHFPVPAPEPERVPVVIERR